MKIRSVLYIVISVVIVLTAFASCISAEDSEDVYKPAGDSINETTEETAEGNAEDSAESVKEIYEDASSAAAPEPAGAETLVGVRNEEHSEYGILGDEMLGLRESEAYSDDFSIEKSMRYEEEDFSAASAPPSQSGLKAGYADDNRQYGYFIDFLEEYDGQVTPLNLNVTERLILTAEDREGRSLQGAKITVSGAGKTLRGLTHADGSYQINPSEFPGSGPLTVRIDPGKHYGLGPEVLKVDRGGSRSISVPFGSLRIIPEPIPLDIVFVMDTTGSMGEEIARLRNTIQIIHLNLTSLSVPAEVRFGMVLYKDIRDEYRTRVIPLTSDINKFQAELDKVGASGGGDTPEDLQAALDDLLNKVDWNPAGIKLAYIITDASAHLDYDADYRIENAARDARERGLKIYGIGTGGLGLQGEYTLRQIAQYTSARYIFLTYDGETGESSGGAAGSVSHHTGSNWSADKLESIVIRFAKEELSYLSDSPLLDEDPWFEADKIDTETAEETLASLFEQAVEQLLDFSTWPITGDTALAVLPFQADDKDAANSEYFNEHFILSAGRCDRIFLAERKDLGQLAAELNYQNTGITDEDTVGELGEFLNAEVLILGCLFMKDGKYELFLKMLRTETAEVLSITRAVIDAELGL